MAAFKELLQPECGGQNALMRLASAVTTDKGLQGSVGHDKLAELAHHGDQQAVDEQLVSEFLGQGHAINTFQMSTLLEQIQRVDQADQEWAESFSKEQALSHSWAEEFMKNHPTAVAPASRDHHLLVEDQWAKEFVEKSTTEQQWADEFVSQCSSSKEEVAAAAKDLVESVQDPTLEGTQFMNFVKKLSTGQTSILDGQVQKRDPESLAKEWADEFAQDPMKLQEEVEFWDRMQKVWESGIGDHDDMWTTEYLQNKARYEFAQENPYRETEDAFQKGMEKLKEGDLPSAILFFEAAVQADPKAAIAWQFLGTCQADNEQEMLAIAALEKCVELEPSNLTALMSLAVSFTNESRSGEACGMLRRWLQANPKYSHLAPAEATPTYTPSFADPHVYKELSHAYITAAQQLPDQLDPQVQVGLGILFNLTREFNKAVDCFQAALSTNASDAMLWNKLGATLANGNRSDEAIHAYREALKLRPDFVRARYNLGISCINLKAHREAVEHFVTALHFQRSASMGGAGREKGSMSDTIWSTLRLALIYLDKQHLLRSVNERDLDTLMEHFNIEQ